MVRLRGRSGRSAHPTAPPRSPGSSRLTFIAEMSDRLLGAEVKLSPRVSQPIPPVRAVGARARDRPHVLAGASEAIGFLEVRHRVPRFRGLVEAGAPDLQPVPQ